MPIQTNRTRFKAFLTIQMQIRIVQTIFKPFEYKIWTIWKGFERDSNHSNANPNHLKGILTIQMPIRTIPTKFEWTIKKRSKQFRMQTWTIRTNIQSIRSIRMQIPTIRKVRTISNHSKRILSNKPVECKFESFEWYSNYLNANSNHSKGILTIRMQIRIVRMIFKLFECKF